MNKQHILAKLVIQVVVSVCSHSQKVDTINQKCLAVCLKTGKTTKKSNPTARCLQLSVQVVVMTCNCTLISRDDALSQRQAAWLLLLPPAASFALHLQQIGRYPKGVVTHLTLAILPSPKTYIEVL